MSQNSRHRREYKTHKLKRNEKETNKKRKIVFQLSSVRNRWQGSRRQLGWEVALFLTPLCLKMPREDEQAIYAENREKAVRSTYEYCCHHGRLSPITG
jgi:hypothetical protein